MEISGERVKKIALEYGLDAAGIAPATIDWEALERARSQVAQGLKPSWSLAGLDKRFHPASELPGAKSVLVVANNYLVSGPESQGRLGQPHGRIARYCWSNYYRDTRERLKQVAEAITKELGRTPGYRIFSNGRLAEKPLAVRAGLGWYGKHGIVVTSDFGSWVVLGLLVTELDLEPDAPVAAGCGQCRACMEACPTKAIVAPMIVDNRRCLQWMSGRQMIFPEDIRMIWGDRLYGCTTCQDVCPFNKKAKPKEGTPDQGWVGPSLPLIPILRMTENEFRAQYRGHQMAERWVSFKAIQRNAAVALGNIGDRAAVPVLQRVAEEDPSPMLREHATWALRMISRGRGE